MKRMGEKVMKKTVVLLILTMIVQLFSGVTPVVAVEISDLVAGPESVPLLAVTLSPGETAGTTAATVTGVVHGSLIVNVTEGEMAKPQMGDTAPTAGDNLFADYESGAAITTGVAVGNYLQIYDVDMAEGARIVAFYQAELTGAEIKEADGQGEPAADTGDESAKDIEEESKKEDTEEDSEEDMEE
ncbi:MAG: hypothetical protein GXX92_12355, partial [Clostridiales bacterium]|nr:hypothetical protein [Clostridiales bacterium]